MAVDDDAISISGAGPAGLAAAITLAKDGRRGMRLYLVPLPARSSLTL